MSGSSGRRLLTPGEVRRLLQAHGLAPNKAYGQNFVVDANTVRKIVRDAGIETGQVVCEIGPGLGSLTIGLREAGAAVIAIEIDAGMVAALRDRMGGDPGTRIVHADALAVDYRTLLGDAPVRMVANLPYNTATPIVIGALESGCFAQLSVMVQKEVGQRWAAGVGDELFGAVSMKLAAFAEVSVIGPISRRAFYPVPNVDSVTVRLTPRPWPYAVSRGVVVGLVSAGFSQRRKRLRNVLAGAGHAPGRVEQALREIGFDPRARAEELDLDAWVELAGRLSTGAGGTV